MTYHEALQRVSKVGTSNTDGDALLAITCEVLAHVHAINPALTYEGAKKRGLTATQVQELDPVSLGDLMFV
jgi:hypothetical protein